MKPFIVLILICFPLIHCLRSSEDNENSVQDVDCPDSTYYFKQIDVLTRYHSSTYDTIGTPNSAALDSLTKSFAIALDYLYSITRLKSHVNHGYLFMYMTNQDYQKDIEQYRQWYLDHCK